MSQIMHIAVASILFSLTWNFLLKRTWAMQDKMSEIGEKLDELMFKLLK